MYNPNGNTNGNQQSKVIPTKVVTGVGRLSYVFIREPDEDDKYSLCFLLPKSDVLSYQKIMMAIEAAKEIGRDKKWSNKIPGNLSLPLRDGDLELDRGPEYAGHWFFNARTTMPPLTVDASKQDIVDLNEVYSGCFGRVSINFYPYYKEEKGARGVACSLLAIQKIAEGERLGDMVYSNPEEDFGDSPTGGYPANTGYNMPPQQMPAPAGTQQPYGMPNGYPQGYPPQNQAPYQQNYSGPVPNQAPPACRNQQPMPQPNPAMGQGMPPQTGPVYVEGQLLNPTGITYVNGVPYTPDGDVSFDPGHHQQNGQPNGALFGPGDNIAA